MFFYGGPTPRWDEGGLTHFRLDPDPQGRAVDTLARSDPEVQTRCPDEQFPGSISLGVEPCGSTPDRKRSDSTGHPGRLHHQNYPGSDKPPSRCNCDASQNRPRDGIVPTVLAEIPADRHARCTWDNPRPRGSSAMPGLVKETAMTDTG